MKRGAAAPLLVTLVAFALRLRPRLKTQLSGDEQTLNFGSTFTDFAKFSIAQETLSREINDIAVSTVDLHTLVSYFGSHFRSIKLGLRAFQGNALVVIFEPGSMIEHEPGSANRSSHVGQVVLNGLEFADGLAESFALLGVGQGSIESGLSDTESQSAN